MCYLVVFLKSSYELLLKVALPVGESMPAMKNNCADIRQATIEWFHTNQRRDLPWRQTFSDTDACHPVVPVVTPLTDPYHVWVSEVMSQQTQMDTVIPYFKRWIAVFPDIATLARATEASVMAVWSGMGYYRRALYLKKGAEHVMKHFGGSLPTTAAQLRAIPGIGLYTSAAIASICFRERIISVDGNVVRVLSRLRCERNFDPKSAKSIKEVFHWGQEIMGEGPCDRPGDFNQGLMEIGARVCKPSGRPLCEECPLHRYCGAYAAMQSGEIPSIEGVIPLRAKTLKKKKEHVFCLVHEFREKTAGDSALKRRFIVVRRPEEGLLGGMLEFPSRTYVSSPDGGTDIKGSRDVTDELRKKLAAGHKNVVEVGHVQHIFSHIDMRVLVYHAVWDGPSLDCGGYTRGTDPRVAARRPSEEKICNALRRELRLDSSRISVKTEEEIKGAAASRLLLKILDKLTPLNSEGRVRKPSTGKRPRLAG